MPCWSQRSEIGVCSRRWSRRMATFSWAVKRFRVFLGMGAPPLEVVAYSRRRFVPFQLKQDTAGRGVLRRGEGRGGFEAICGAKASDGCKGPRRRDAKARF